MGDKTPKAKTPGITEVMLGIDEHSKASPVLTGYHTVALVPVRHGGEMTPHGEPGGHQRNFPGGPRYGSDEGGGRKKPGSRGNPLRGIGHGRKG